MTRLVVGTRHQELSQAAREWGANVLASLAAVEAALEQEEPQGILVSQDLPGLSPERVEAWNQEYPGRVGLWLEERVPPGWATLPEAVTVWTGEIQDAELMRWVQHLSQPGSRWGDAARVGVVMAPVPEQRAIPLATRWARRLLVVRGPGLLVDGDWDGAGLTESMAPECWTRPWLGEPALVRKRTGWILPAPPPWEMGPREMSRERAVRLTQEGGYAWILVHVGSDLRRPLNARWVALADHLVLAHEGDPELRLEKVAAMARELSSGLDIALYGVRKPWPRVDLHRLPRSWPDLTPEENGSPGRFWGLWARGAIARRQGFFRS